MGRIIGGTEKHERKFSFEEVRNVTKELTEKNQDLEVKIATLEEEVEKYESAIKELTEKNQKLSKENDDLKKEIDKKEKK